MAKKKKLNKKVVVLIVALGVVILLGLSVFIIPRVLPKNVNSLVQEAQKATKAGDLKGAEKAYGKAIQASAGNPAEQNRYRYELAQVLWAYRNSALTASEKREKILNSISVLRNILTQDKNMIEAQRLLCDVLWQINRPADEYIAEATNLLALTPNDADIYFRRAEKHGLMGIQVQNEHVQLAIDDYRKAIELKKTDPLYWIRLAVFLEAIKTKGDPIDVYRQAIAANPTSADLYIAFAEYYRRHDNTAEARKMIRKAVEMAPKDAKAYLALAQQHILDRNRDEAIKAVAQAKQLDPSDINAYKIEAALYLSQGQMDKAVTCIRDGLSQVSKQAQSQPESSSALKIADTRFQLNNLLANLLLDSLSGKKADEAKPVITEVKTLLESITKLAPNSPYRTKLAGRLDLVEGKPGEAVKYLEEADKALGGRDPETLNALLNTYMVLGRPGDAEQRVDKFLSIPGNGRNAAALIFKAKLAKGYRDYDRARQCLAIVLEDDKSNADAKSLMQALNAIARDDVTLPEGKLTADALRLYVERALMLWSSGDRANAIRLLESVHRREPANMPVALQLVNFYVNNANEAQAKDLLTELGAEQKDPAVKAKFEELVKLLSSDPDKRYDMLMQLADKEKDPLQRALSKANFAASMGNTADYEKYLNEAKTLAPDNPAVIGKTFDLAIQKKDWPTADEALKRATAADLDTVKGKIFQARLELAKGLYPQAITTLEAILNDRPELKQVQLMLAEAYRLNSDDDRAEENYRSLAKSDPGFFPAVLGMALVTDKLSRMEEHRTWVESAYRLQPNHPYISEQHLLNEESRLRPEEMIRKREELFRKQPSDLANAYRLANLYESVHQPDAAEKLYVFVSQNMSDRIAGARVLIGYYLRNNRQGEIDKLVEQLLTTPNIDKVGVYVMYGDALQSTSRDQAMAAYRKAVEADPKDARGYLSIAQALGAQGKWDDAITNLRKYLEIRPQSPREQKLLVGFLIEGGKLDEAQQLCDAMLAKKPSDSDALAQKAIIAQRKGHVDQAEELFTSAINQNKNMIEPLLARGAFYLSQSELNKARKDYEAASKLAPSRLDVLFQIAMVDLRLYDKDRAVQTLSEILDRQKDHDQAFVALVSLYLQDKRYNDLQDLLAQYRKQSPNNVRLPMIEAEMYKGMGDTEKRIAALERARKLSPDSPDVLRVYLIALTEAGKYDEALSQLAALGDEKSAQYDWLPLVKARAMAGKGQAAQADAIFESAFKSLPDNRLELAVQIASQSYPAGELLPRLAKWLAQRPAGTLPNLLMGTAAMTAKDYVQAQKALVKALETAKTPLERAQINGLLGMSYYQDYNRTRDRQDLAKAENAFLAALKDSEKDIQSLNNLAYLYADEMNDPAKAYPYAKLAAKLRPDANVLDTLGWTAARLADSEKSESIRAERFNEAEQILLRSVQLDPQSTNRYHLGWVYEMTQRPAEAVKQYRQAIAGVRDENDPLYKEISAGLKRLSR